MSSLWLWVASLFLLAAAGTWLARGYALRRRLLDQPGERRSHQVATPRGGGIAIVFALLVAGLWAALRWPQAGFSVMGGMVGLALVAGVGWWDDHRPLSARLRLAVHAIASLILGGLVWHASGQAWMGAATALASVGLINVWNFMDGINGLATSQAALAAAAFACWLPAPLSWAGWAVAAACLGFLPFNFPRARIFLGDGGSGALGYALAVLFGTCLVQGASLWTLWLPLGTFLVDAGFTLAARMLSGQRWWEPHAQHVYQRLARRFGHARVTFGYVCTSIVAIALFFRLQAVQPRWEAAGSIGWLLAASVIWLLLRKGLRNQ
ncbi:MAG TPA: glycosyltransferase family 4 protein [Stenotrophomonas sp.]|jgi:UDP-N-acetylmuramyl pentapeptide phosphotransferase/UDP-N-acetylglucosamine-1-phosphate transferase